MSEKQYKFGKPNKYGDFPYLNIGEYKAEQLPEILEERLPDYYPMEIVDPIEEKVLDALVNLGIDSHLEAATLSKTPELVGSADRKCSHTKTRSTRL